MDTFDAAIAPPKEKCFEDAFMEVLSDYVSLCLEATSSAVDVIYGFMYRNSGMLTADAFFRKDENFLYPDDFMDNETIARFFEIGLDDVEKLVAVCGLYSKKCPNEVKMVYHAQSKQFDVQLGYRDYVRKDGIDPDAAYCKWLDEEKSKLHQDNA